MALFTVNRYMGEEGSSGAKNSTQSIIEKLNAKAREREKQRKSVNKLSAKSNVRESRDRSPNIERRNENLEIAQRKEKQTKKFKDNASKSPHFKKQRNGEDKLVYNVNCGVRDTNPSSAIKSKKKKSLAQDVESEKDGIIVSNKIDEFGKKKKKEKLQTLDNKSLVENDVREEGSVSRTPQTKKKHQKQSSDKKASDEGISADFVSKDDSLTMTLLKKKKKLRLQSLDDKTSHEVGSSSGGCEENTFIKTPKKNKKSKKEGPSDFSSASLSNKIKVRGLDSADCKSNERGLNQSTDSRSTPLREGSMIEDTSFSETKSKKKKRTILQEDAGNEDETKSKLTDTLLTANDKGRTSGDGTSTKSKRKKKNDGEDLDESDQSRTSGDGTSAKIKKKKKIDSEDLAEYAQSRSSGDWSSTKIKKKKKRCSEDLEESERQLISCNDLDKEVSPVSCNKKESVKREKKPGSSKILAADILEKSVVGATDSEVDDIDEEDDDDIAYHEADEMDVDEDDDDELQDEEGSSFVVLGDFEKRSKKKVRETLPDWLAHPSVIERNLSDNCVSLESIKGLDQRLVATLESMGIAKFFPVQHNVIPVVLDSLKHGLHTGEAGFRPRDLCVSAATGSGKTLAYSIPVVQALIDRVVPRVRALIVLPTRDLATQVYKVVTSLCKNTPLKVVLVGGTKKFAQEQSQLVKEKDGEYHSLADIVVATPGRLVDNIHHTPGFTLQHLRFLVIDEADRMMDQISQDWIAQVEKAAYSSNTPDSHNGMVSSLLTSVRTRPGPLTVARTSVFQLPLQKLLFSATLSQNPEKLMQLRLFRPRLITTATGNKVRPFTLATNTGHTLSSLSLHGTDVDGNDEVMMATTEKEGEILGERSEFIGKYTTPVGLSEYFVECTAGEKPLVLMHLLTHLHFKQVLCFTNTVEATHRLFLLLQLMGGVEVAEFSSKLQQSQRQTILKQFKAAKIQILVCSDAMARGMDIENVKCVISYDLPPHLKTYIHRVGRTARAGRAGTAFSLIKRKEVTKFKQMLKNAGKDRIERHHMSSRQLDSFIPSYEDALGKLQALLKEEKAHHY